MDEITPTEAPEPTVPEPPSTPKPKERHWLVALLFDLGSTLIPAIIIALLIHVFLAQATRVYGQSMEPNLHTNQRLVIEKLSYHFHGPRRGDVIVIHDPGGSPELLIKRVIGLPGERITVTDGRVYIDGKTLDEPYLTQPTQGNGRSWIVPPLHVFVMGDNRSASRDSRIFGPVPLDQIVGHAVVRYWPPEQIGVLN
jgi:signal peptidase I